MESTKPNAGIRECSKLGVASDEHAGDGDQVTGALTYRQFINKTYPESGRQSQRTRTALYAVNEWVSSNSMTLDDLIGDEIAGEFDQALDRLVKAKSKTGVTQKTLLNLTAVIRSLRSAILCTFSDDGIPKDFIEALRYGLRRLGKSAFSAFMQECLDKGAYNWAMGYYKPDPVRFSIKPERIAKLEAYLKFPPGTLQTRLPFGERSTEGLIQLNSDIPYRRYLKMTRKAPYILKLEELPDSVRLAMAEYQEHKAKCEHLLPSGEVFVMDVSDKWSSKATTSISTDLHLGFWGWANLQKAPSGGDTDWLTSIQYGAGIPIEDFRFTMLVDKKMLFEYMKWRELRSFDKEHFLQYERSRESNGMACATSVVTISKTLPQSFLVFLHQCIGLVNRPTSFFRLHPEFGRELDPPIPPNEWQAWCDERFKELKSIEKAAKKKVKKGKRSNKEILNPILREQVPSLTIATLISKYEHDMQNIYREETLIQAKRDLVILKLLNFEPLRIKNLWMLNIGEHVVETSDGRYRLCIPAVEMKNYIHGYAEDRDRLLPEDICESLHEWIDVYRPKIPWHIATDALFIGIRSHQARRWREGDRTSEYRIYKSTIDHAIRKITRVYLGVSLGAHAFRNIAAQTASKNGTPDMVRAILNDSPQVANQIYKDSKNEDEMSKLSDLYSSVAELAKKKMA